MTTAFVLSCLLLIAAASSCWAFAPVHRSSVSTTSLFAVDYDTVADVGYMTTVPKPLGVVFGENKDPFFGLVVDEIAEDMNGDKAGLRVGDQLLAINGKVVIGKPFEDAMSSLQDAPGSLDLVLYRGSVSSLFTILDNRVEDLWDGLGEYEEEEEEIIIMDENYETPVVIEVKERKPLTPGDFFKAIKKAGSILTEDGGEKQSDKKKGFFGIGGDTVQLDGDEAKGLK